MKLNRRGFLAGAGLVMAAPAIVRADTLMQLPRRPWPPFLLRADGRLVCNGALLRVADFPELFSVLGSSYGGGDSHFRLPDLTSAVPASLGSVPLRYLINTAPLPNGPTGTLVLSP